MILANEEKKEEPTRRGSMFKNQFAPQTTAPVVSANVKEMEKTITA